MMHQKLKLKGIMKGVCYKDKRKGQRQYTMEGQSLLGHTGGNKEERGIKGRKRKGKNIEGRTYFM